MQVTTVTKITGASINLNVSEAVELGSEIEYIFKNLLTEKGIADRFIMLTALYNGLQIDELIQTYEEERENDAGAKVRF